MSSSLVDGGEVGSDEAVDVSGEVSLEASDDFLLREAFCGPSRSRSAFSPMATSSVAAWPVLMPSWAVTVGSAAAMRRSSSTSSAAISRAISITRLQARARLDEPRQPASMDRLRPSSLRPPATLVPRETGPVRSNRRHIALPVVVAVGLALAALGGGSAAQDPEVTRLLEAADPIELHDAGVAFTTPRVVSCMEARGYDGYIHRPSVRADLSAVDPTDDLVGFGVSRFAFEDIQLAVEVWSLSPEAQDRWQANRQPAFDPSWSGDRYMRAIADARDCEDSAEEDFATMLSDTVGLDVVDRFRRTVATERKRDRAIAVATTQWADCMVAQGHDYGSAEELRSRLQAEFDLNHIYGAGAGLPDAERLQRQLDAIAEFRDHEIALGRASDGCSGARWEAETALRERIAAEILADDEA